MAGVGETGVWRTGVWVEPLDFEGSFDLAVAADLSFEGYFAYAGTFDLHGAAVMVFDGDLLYRGDFALESDGLLAFEGQATVVPGNGIFGFSANAKLVMAWMPDLGPPTGGDVIPDPDGQPSVEVPYEPGQVVVINGVSGTVVKDSYGRLVVMDDSGKVLCIIGPGGIELL